MGYESSMRSNLHPVDRLAVVRAEIASLEAEQERLRRYLIAHAEDREGADYTAHVVASSCAKLDLRGLVEAVGAEVVTRFTSRSRFPLVRLKPKRDG